MTYYKMCYTKNVNKADHQIACVEDKVHGLGKQLSEQLNEQLVELLGNLVDLVP